MKKQIGSFFYTPPKRKDVIRHKRWNWPGILGRALKRTCMVIGGIVLFSICMGIFLGALLGGSSKSLPDDMILVLNVENRIGESAMQARLTDPFAPQTITVHQLIESIERAKADTRVRGLLVSLDNAGFELAHIQEVRAAIKNFRSSGKFAHIYTPSFTELGSSIGAYYFATAFDDIWMQPVGMLSITGIALEMPYAKKALDKLGAKAEFLQREEYKSAMESMTHEEMTPANRDAMKSILDDLSMQITLDIAQDRDKTPEEVQALVDKGLLTGDEALAEGLVDRIDYADVLVDQVRGDKTAEELPLVSIDDYHRQTVAKYESDRKGDIALVNVSGQIVSGSQPDPGFATADYIANALHDATEDENIKIIVVRVDSPGGSPTASETIRRAIVNAKEEGKKVIVSMGPVAASGGYWLSADADRIFALPSTLTGSIGVVMGKFNIGGVWDKLGINWDGMRWGENAGLWSMNKSFTSAEMERLNAAIDSTYQGFITRVSKGRNMTPEQVREVARGRAWTGAQASENGLVDEIGGLDNALDYAAVQIGHKNRNDANVVIMPKPLTPVEQLMMLMGEQVGAARLLKENAGLLGVFKPVTENIESMNRIGPFQSYDPDLRRVQP